jgi:glycerophosphoryl diester phosphodiesterase
MLKDYIERTLVIAHRGFSSEYPENTIVAFEAAISVGADVIETDIRLSRDGIAMCSHDPDLIRLLGRDEAIAELDATDLEKFGVARLETVLATVRGRIKVMLDFKLTTESGMAPAFSVVQDLDMGSEVYAGARSLEAIPVIRRLCPQASIIGLVSRSADLEAFHRAGCIIGRLWEDEATKAGLDSAKADGLNVWVTTGGRREGDVGNIDQKRLKRLLADGADGIIVNDPEQAIAVRSACGQPRDANQAFLAKTKI